jgi:CHAD domain-containing protein
MIVLAYRCLQHDFGVLVSLRPSAAAPPSADDVHQMRIATRRLRVALRLFAHMLPPRAATNIAGELRWLAGALGGVRDLDVHAKAFRNFLRSVAADDAQRLSGYELHLTRDRAAARSGLNELLTSERYAALIDALAALLDGAPSLAALRRWQSFRVCDGAAKYLKKSRKRVRRLGRKLGRDAHDEELHRLRIRTKRLRYEIEFFLDVYPQFAPAAKAAKALQDVLGAHQDACAARERIKAYSRILRAHRKDGVVPAAALVPWRASQEQQAEAARRAFPAEWARFAQVLKNATFDVD